MRKCYLCQSDALEQLLDFGLQPISNRFLSDPCTQEFLAPLGISQCHTCGLVQITQPVAAQELRPPYDWITYNEPEPHLDQLADTIAHLPGLSSQDGIWGVSFKDDSLLRRLEHVGFQYTYRLNMQQDLGIIGKGAGVETIQDKMDPSKLANLAEIRGKPKVIIARHIVEHAHDFTRFMHALLAMAASDGYIVLEAPDCQRALELLDYTTIWEEHTIYFTPEMFRMIFPYYNMSTIYFEVFPYAFENSLVGIGKLGTQIEKPTMTTDILAAEKNRMQTFAENLPHHRQRFAQFFNEYRKRNGKIAMFGAGHLACAFINYLELKEYISFVVDDNPNKQGLLMPASRVPVRPSSALLEEGIKLALFSLSPEVEDKVVLKNNAFIEQGGQFSSIFPASKRAIKVG